MTIEKPRSLAVFLMAVVGGGLTIGVLTAPGAWYGDLIKPVFNPPNWVFGPAWTVLYVLIAIAGWRVWQNDRGGVTMKFWYVQMLLNFVWSPMFFGFQRTDAALGIILLLLAAIAGFAVSAWRNDRISALLFVPYAAWVAFATALNGSILYLNLPVNG